MTSPGRDSIGDFLISARSFAEYRAMFALTDADLRGRILDCPGGGASFTATAGALGLEAVAVDPVYATPPDRLAERMVAELQRGRQFANANTERYVWDFYGDPDGHTRVRAESAHLFAEDLLANRHRYVGGALPCLPFPDGAFDLVLSSHLLFTYADRLDPDFHLAAVREMARVCRGVVRIYPLVDQAGRPVQELLDGLVGRLAASGLRARVTDVGYEFQRGAREMLEVLPRRAGTTTDRS
jgi:Methyltransferase domain